MAGLLDMLSSGDPGLLTALSIMSAGRAQPQRQSIAEGLLGGMQVGQQAKQAQDEALMKKQQFGLQQQQAQMQLQQLQEAAKQRAALEAWRQSIPAPQGEPLPAGPYMGAARDSQAANVPQPTAVDPRQMQMYGAMKAGGIDPLQYLQMQVKDNTPVKLGAGEILAQRQADGSYRNLLTNPKEQTPDEFTRALQAAGIDPASPQARALAMQHLQKMATHQPATQVSVNTGQKGFDNTLKLRGDFRSEPVYKAHQEMQSAYAQIGQSLKAGTAIGDTAAATKIMKLLDPTSVVRESELGMALAATGLADRVGNFAQAILNGQRLNPQQRKDFAALSDALYSESVKQYNAKRTEYEGIAQRNQLNVPDVVGTPSSLPAPAAGGWSIKPKGQ